MLQKRVRVLFSIWGRRTNSVRGIHKKNAVEVGVVVIARPINVQDLEASTGAEVLLQKK